MLDPQWSSALEQLQGATYDPETPQAPGGYRRLLQGSSFYHTAAGNSFASSNRTGNAVILSTGSERRGSPVGPSYRGSDNFAGGMCYGGFAGLQAVLPSIRFDGPGICPPAGTTLIQLVRIFIGYADRHPEDLHKSWVEVTLKAAHEAFRCTASVQ
jgi:hypothetical protein